MKIITGILLSSFLLGGCASRLPKAAEAGGESITKGLEVVGSVRKQALDAFRFHMALTAPGGKDANKLVVDVLCGHHARYKALITVGLAEEALGAAAARLPKLAAAPKGTGLVATVVAIGKHTAAASSFKADASPVVTAQLAQEELARREQACVKSAQTALKDAAPGAPPPYAWSANALGAQIAAVMTFKEFLTTVAGMLEEAQRAKAIRAYIQSQRETLEAAVLLIQGAEGDNPKSGLRSLARDVQLARMSTALYHAGGLVAAPALPERDRREHAADLLKTLEAFESVRDLQIDDPKKSVSRALSDAVAALVKAADEADDISLANLEALVDAVGRLDKTYKDFDKAKGSWRDAF